MPQNNDHGFRVISGFDDRRMAGACDGYFREYTSKNATPAKPFFMVASFDNPHNVCEFARRMPLPWADIGEMPPVDKLPPLPRNFDPPDIEPEIVRVEQKANFMIYPSVSYSENDWRRLRWGYFRLVEWVDREIGKVLDSLSSHGLENDTIVIFMSDHGDAHGSHRWNQKSILYEETVRIPLVVRIPGMTKGEKSSALISAPLDTFATICNLAGIMPPENVCGKNLYDVACNPKTDTIPREYIAVETIFDGGRGYNTAGRAIITGSMKYVVYDRGKDPEQLFDLTTDQGEMHNLVTKNKHDLSRFRQMFLDWQSQTNDPFMHPVMSDGKRK